MSDEIESSYQSRYLVLDYMNKKNILFALGTRIREIQNAKYLFQLRNALQEFLRFMGCLENKDQRIGNVESQSQGSINGAGSIETNSVDSRDSLSTMTRRDKDSTIFSYPFGVAVKSQQDFDLWTQILMTEGCSFLVRNTIENSKANLKDNSKNDSRDYSKDFSKELINNSNLSNVHITTIFDDIITDSLISKNKDSDEGDLSQLGMDDWILRTQSNENKQAGDSNISQFRGVDVILVDWYDYRNQMIKSQSHLTNETKPKSRILYMTHLVHHFINLMHVKCIVSYLSLTKQNTLKDKTSFLQQMNSCIALFLRIIEGLFLFMAEAKSEHESFSDWIVNLDQLSNLFSEEWIHENIKEWILDAIRAALLRKRIALKFIDSIGVGQVVAILRSRKYSIKLREKCVQVICLLFMVAQLADEHKEGKYYQDLVMERIGVYLGKKLTEELRNVRFDEESFLSFIARCDGRF